jgi:hypothetical protein
MLKTFVLPRQHWGNNFVVFVQKVENAPLILGKTAKNAFGDCTTVSVCAKIITTQQARNIIAFPER